MADKMTLDEFRGSFVDVAKTNRFKVTFEGPALSKYGTSETQNNLTFWCSKVVLPKIELSGPIIKYMGRSAMLAGDIKELTTSLTVISAITGYGVSSARNFFENWMMDIVDHSNLSNYRKSVDEYLMDNSIIIEKFGSVYGVNTPIGEYYLYNVFPTSLSEINLDMASSDSPEEFTVDFRYTGFDNFLRGNQDFTDY